MLCLFFFNDTATTEIYTLSLHDALPISISHSGTFVGRLSAKSGWSFASSRNSWRSEEHTSELQSRLHLVCRLLLEKKKEARAYVVSAASGLADSYRLRLRALGLRPGETR